MSPSLSDYLYKVVLKVEDVNEKEQKNSSDPTNSGGEKPQT